MDFTAENYSEKPTDGVLEKKLEEFIAANGEKKLKCGLTCYPWKRYGLKDFWHMIKDRNHFAYSTSHDVARHIEVRMMEILRKRGQYFEHQDTGVGGRSDKKDNVYTIYLVAGKTEDDKCEICGRVWIEAEEERERHMKHHNNEKHALEWLLKASQEQGYEEGEMDAKDYLGWPSRAKDAGKEPKAKKMKKNN